MSRYSFKNVAKNLTVGIGMAGAIMALASKGHAEPMSYQMSGSDAKYYVSPFTMSIEEVCKTVGTKEGLATQKKNMSVSLSEIIKDDVTDASYAEAVATKIYKDLDVLHKICVEHLETHRKASRFGSCAQTGKNMEYRYE